MHNNTNSLQCPDHFADAICFDTVYSSGTSIDGYCYVLWIMDQKVRRKSADFLEGDNTEEDEMQHMLWVSQLAKEPKWPCQNPLMPCHEHDAQLVYAKLTS
eukprot:2010240-Ditylum_brightwellii.AAC.1